MLEPNLSDKPKHTSQSASVFIAVGFLSIDLHARTASVRGQRLALSPLEFDVLIHLACHAGRAVPHSELLREVWRCGLHNGGTKNQVNCCLKRLRKKLAAHPGDPPYLLNVHGLGWRMLKDDEWWARMKPTSK